FYEGPPTANGLPHPGHCLTRAVKDLFPRYKTMRGYLCRRKAGWDTHGLPVEVEVCKELGIHSKEEIEAYGVEPFNRKCVESVFRYTQQWEQLTERLGFWIHLDEAYVTFHQSYVESVWWALKNLFDRGLLYQGYKIVWWWAQGGTALSSGEVGQGYREVADPSVYVRFPIIIDDKAKELGLGDNACLLVWTTTPWTLPGNHFAAVNPDMEYSLIVDPTDGKTTLIVASTLEHDIIEKVVKSDFRAWVTRKRFKGKELSGLRYMPPFPDVFYRQTVGKFAQGPSTNVFDQNEKTLMGEFFAPIQVPRWGKYLGWRVLESSFVTADSGTGVVHIAPAFGEDDYNLWQTEVWDTLAPPFDELLLCPVAANGTFTDDVEQFKGRWVKDCDRDIIRQLKTEGKLFHQEQYLHDYPFCWRAEEDPLIQYPRRSWFIRTTKFKEAMLANNSRINWLPEHIRDGRFGNFLETNVDWALSRERYWGTPLPIWVCEKTGYAEAVASYADLLAKPGLAGTEVWKKAKRENPDLPDDLAVHKPYIDAITYDSPKAPGARMRRVPEVIDCWFDAGAMPFAQWGYPHQPGSDDSFQGQFPADFISEALDQTRGWFYSLLAISTLLFSENGGRENAQPSPPAPLPNGEGSKTNTPQSSDSSPQSLAPSPSSHDYPHPFRNCIVLGLMLGEDGGKMSKSKRNYREPNEILNRYGADALRWYFFSNQPPWTSIRYSEQAIKDCIPEFLLRLWNVYSFFVIYANIDKFEPAAHISGGAGQLTAEVLATARDFRPVANRSELDRWIISELNRTIAAVTERMDAYDNFDACACLSDFVDALSNWYVRRSRDRFWSGEQSADKADAYWTLYECLLTTCKLIAPFVPFLAEEMWQNLAAAAFADKSSEASPLESVHLCDYPVADRAALDEMLSKGMNLVREVVSQGRSARMASKVKVRQPLSLAKIALTDVIHQTWLEQHKSLILDELNVKDIEFNLWDEVDVDYRIDPNWKLLGPRLGKRLPILKKYLQDLTSSEANEICADLESIGQKTITLRDGPVTLEAHEVFVRPEPRPGTSAAKGPNCVVVLNLDLTTDLIREGLARDVVRVIQDRRKEMNCNYTDRICVGFVTDSAELTEAVQQFSQYIQDETLALEIDFTPPPGAEAVEVKVGDYSAMLSVKKA
ncbi:MAG: class I tRNA ligase family protein, partial [Thermoguttaceae bacterium]